MALQDGLFYSYFLLYQVYDSATSLLEHNPYTISMN